MNLFSKLFTKSEQKQTIPQVSPKPVVSLMMSTSQRFRNPFTPRAIFLICFLVFSLLLAFYVIFSAQGIIKIYALTWSLSLVALGGFFGFLFGLPNKPFSNGSNIVLDNNIIEISNWLTKIIIGAGLVQLKEIPSFISEKVRKIAFGLAEQDSSEKVFIFTFALLMYSFLLGVVGGYIITQIFLNPELNNVISRSTYPEIENSFSDEQIELS